MSADRQVTIVGEIVQVRLLRSVSGYGRRGTLVSCGLDVAAGLMEARLAEYVDLIGFTAVEDFPEGVPDGSGESATVAGGGAGDGVRRRKTRSVRVDPVDAEPGEGVDAG